MFSDYRGFLLFAVLLMTTTVFGQDRQRAGRTAPAKSSAPAVSSNTTRAVIGTSGTISRGSAIPSRRSWDIPNPGTSPRNGQAGGGGVQIPVQTYAPNFDFNWTYWNRTTRYVDYLMGYYSFLPGPEYLWRYAQGDSPLTPGSVRLALQESSDRAVQLVDLSRKLELLIDQYESGAITRQDFELQVRQTTDRIKDQAKQIRKDYFLDYVDLREDRDFDSPSRVASIPQLRQQAASLTQLSYQINQGIASYTQSDASRVVSVDDLKEPSLESLAKGVDRIANTIKDSAGRL